MIRSFPAAPAIEPITPPTGDLLLQTTFALLVQYATAGALLASRIMIPTTPPTQPAVPSIAAVLEQ